MLFRVGPGRTFFSNECCRSLRLVSFEGFLLRIRNKIRLTLIGVVGENTTDNSLPEDPVDHLELRMVLYGVHNATEM